jgi:hypothetical protein
MESEQNAENAFPGKGPSQGEEVGQLQRENQRLKETVEILPPVRSPPYSHVPELVP